MLIFLKKKMQNRSVPNVEHRSFSMAGILCTPSLSLVESEQKLKKLLFTVFLLDIQY